MRQDDTRLEMAIDALKDSRPNSEEIAASSERVAAKLGIAVEEGFSAGTIANCDDVQHLLAAYRSGTLSTTRSLLVEAHLRECGPCYRQLRSASGDGSLDWSAPKPNRPAAVRPRVLGWALALSFALVAGGLFVYKAYWQVPPGVRAEVQSIDGSAYRVSSEGERKLSPGDTLGEGDHLRTGGGSHVVIRLADGSTVEMNQRGTLAVDARGHNMTVALDDGAVIVQAAKRTSGHLYVKTPDCRVAVTGTVFSVNAGIKGSRVGVLQGTLQVAHAGATEALHAGDQMTTSANLSPTPLAQQVAWSQDRAKYLGIVAQLANLEHKIGQIPFPEPRYSSDLLQRVPADTALYVSIPNLGDFLSQAHAIFQDQLSKNPEFQQWWDQGHGANTAELDALVGKLHDVSQYLGDEIVVVGSRQADHPGFAVLTDVRKSGLGDLLKSQFASGASGGLTILDEQSLRAVPSVPRTRNGGYALIRQHEAVFSNSIETLKAVDAQLNAGASGFAAGDFGQQIAAAYGRGAGIILAADLHQMLAAGAGRMHGRKVNENVIQSSGMEGVRYLIAEHRETNGVPENHLNLQFAGTRERVASWLASPAPIGSLDFVTPNAAIAVAMLSKDPKSIADDMIAMLAGDDGAKLGKLSEAESEMQISFRDDLLANLDGDFLLSLDGPVLPTPSWKAVIEVNNPDRLEQTLERITQVVRDHAQGKDAHAVAIEPTTSGDQRFYAVQDLTSGTVVAQYTFSDGFMIIAPSRALLMEAIRTHQSGNSLARSAAFKALLPKDDNANYSAVAYQNLSPVIAPLLPQLSGESADAIRQLAADARPTVICAWGKDTRIEAASDSRLFGFDFLTLGALVNSRNQATHKSVTN